MTNKTIRAPRKVRTISATRRTRTRAAAVAPTPAPAPAPAPTVTLLNRTESIIALLSRAEGATIDQMRAVTGWQAHSVRGFLSGTVRKKRGLTLTSSEGEAGRVYRIDGDQAA